MKQMNVTVLTAASARPQIKKGRGGQEFLAEWLIAYRDRNKLTQEDMAQKLNVAQSAIARLERGSHWPSLKTISRLCETFNIRVTLVFYPDGSISID